VARISREPGPHNFVPALAFYALGRRDDSDRALQNLIRLHAEDGAYDVAEVYAFRGEIDRAVSWLDRAYSQHDTDLTKMKGDPLLKNLTGDPRYKAFFRKTNLPE
jgi:adenylate cyclase